MALMRVLNHIPKRRHLILSNTSHYLNIIFNVRRDIWYSAKKKPVIKFVPSETKNIDFVNRERKRFKIMLAGLIVLVATGVGAMFHSVRQMRNVNKSIHE